MFAFISDKHFVNSSPAYQHFNSDKIKKIGQNFIRFVLHNNARLPTVYDSINCHNLSN